MAAAGHTDAQSILIDLCSNIIAACGDIDEKDVEIHTALDFAIANNC